MSGFLYFIPFKTGLQKKDIEEAGLADVMYNIDFIQRHAADGPSKTGGCVCVPKYIDDDSVPKVGYFPDRQDWAEANGGKYWIGTEIKKPVKPEDLRRGEFIDGYEMKLNDGNTWTIPIARIFDGGTSLDSEIILGPNGELVSEIIPRYVKFGNMAEKIWNILKKVIISESDDIPENQLSNLEIWKICIEALSINYIIGQWGVSKLRLLTKFNQTDILHFIVDYPKMKAVSDAQYEAHKKKRSAGTPISSESKDGITTSSEIISPPLPISKSMQPSHNE